MVHVVPKSENHSIVICQLQFLHPYPLCSILFQCVFHAFSHLLPPCAYAKLSFSSTLSSFHTDFRHHCSSYLNPRPRSVTSSLFSPFSLSLPCAFPVAALVSFPAPHGGAMDGRTMLRWPHVEALPPTAPSPACAAAAGISHQISEDTARQSKQQHALTLGKESLWRATA